MIWGKGGTWSNFYFQRLPLAAVLRRQAVARGDAGSPGWGWGRCCSDPGEGWRGRWEKAIPSLITSKVEPTGFPDRFDVGCAEIEESRTTWDFEDFEPEPLCAINGGWARMWTEQICEIRSSLFEMLPWRYLFDVQKGNVKKRTADGVGRKIWAGNAHVQQWERRRGLKLWRQTRALGEWVYMTNHECLFLT